MRRLAHFGRLVLALGAAAVATALPAAILSNQLFVLVLLLGSIVTAAHAVLIGLPAYLVLKRSHPLNYSIAALAGFTSYSVGHNLGASVFTGSAVRYRIYSAHGLDAIDVAKVCFVAGLTFWLGNAAVLGLGISYTPGAATA